jgi:hypothetical protein
MLANSRKEFLISPEQADIPLMAISYISKQMAFCLSAKPICLLEVEVGEGSTCFD